MGVANDDAKTVALPPLGHGSTADEVGMLPAVGVGVAQGEGAVVIAVPLWERTPLLKIMS